MRRYGLLLMVLLLGVSALPAHAGDEQGSSFRSERKLRLALGDELFWDGEGIDQASVPDPSLCGITGPCFDYPLKVRESGTRLRVALSAVFRDPEDVRTWPDFLISAPEMIFGLQLFEPGADPRVDDPVDEGSTGETFTTYAVEVDDLAPSAGEYTVRVIPARVTDMAFRMRAKLEGEAPVVNGDALNPPNLRVIPPFELSFSAPTATYGPGPNGLHPGASCMAEETEEAIEAGFAPPQLCLRYSMGFENAGDGRFEVAQGSFLQNCMPDLVVCRLHQTIYRRDGTIGWRGAPGSAGTSKNHLSHGHVHYQNVWEFELLTIDDRWRRGGPAPAMTLSGKGRKLGVAPSNEVMADWHRFYQQDRDFRNSAGFQLQPGWGDTYEWNRSGNYVDFPQDPVGSRIPKEGFYVLRGVTDPLELIIESDETDNVSYAFIEVNKNGRVELIERGYGTDPWDPDKTILTVVP